MNNFKQLKTIGLEVQILALFKQSQDNKVRASLQTIADLVKATKDEVRYAIDNMIEDNKITRNKDSMSIYYSVINDIEVEAKLHDRDIAKATSIVYMIYNKFKEFHVGKENAISMQDLAKWYNVSDREIRDIIYRINFRGFTLKNGVTFKRKILGDNNGYYMVSNKNEMLSMLSKRKNKLLKAVEEFNILQEDFALDNQYKLQLSEYEQDKIKSISDDL